MKPQTIVGFIAGNSLPLISLTSSYVDIPVDPSHPMDDSRIIRMHIGNVPGLIGTLTDILQQWAATPEGQQAMVSANHLRAVVADAGLEINGETQ